MSVRPISSLERRVALPITSISLIFLIFAIIGTINIISVINYDTPAQDIPNWVVWPAFVMLYGALPLGTILIYLGASLKIDGDSIARYGIVIGTGAAVILFWFLVWGRVFLFTSFG